jgi:phenylalanyl-tRNA synthetase beta chain
MRSTLLGSLLGVLQYNLARKSEYVRVFELGRVFFRDPTVSASLKTLEGINQPRRLGGLAYGTAQDPQWGLAARAVDFYDVKGDLEALLAPLVAEFSPVAHPALHPGRSAQISLAGQVIGFIGELHPRWRQAYDLPQAPVLFELDAQAVGQKALPHFRPVSKFQVVTRDIALLVGDGLTAQAIMAAIRASDSEILRDVVLFDVYRPNAGERSLAIRLELLSDEMALNEEQINQIVQKALDAVRPLGARLRE